ncbi:MAG: ATP-binding protein [Dehalococcoidia bacterium]|nr:ATP-binding protein [Dehalococcoidia bacterium]
MIRIKIQSFKIILSDILNKNSSNEKIVPEFYGFMNLITRKINDIKDEIDYSKSVLELYEISKNSLDDGIMLLDFDMNILNFNNKLISLLDSSELYLSKNNKVTDITKNLDIIEFCTESVSKNHNEKIIELSFPTRYFSIKSELINQYLLVVIKDVTDFISLDKTRKEFFANTSHELKTPITSMKLNIEALQNSKIKGNDSDYEFFLEKIKEDSNRLEKISKDIIDVHAIESGELIVNLEDIQISDLINELHEEFSTILDSKRIKFEYSIQKKIPKIKIDKSMFKTALENLISNAIRYSQKDSKIELKCIYDDENIYFNLRDFGIGISDKDLPHIFERFYRVDGLRSERHSGIGLSIVKQIVDVHNGNIAAESSINEGLLIKIKIPFR